MKNKILIILLAAITIIVFTPAAFSQQTEQGYALIVEQSPPDTGMVTPNVGVHRQQLNETVIVQAIPKPGYKFVYWMGDVLSPTANRTSISLDAPKLIIAVFEREEFALLSRSNVSIVSGGSGGGAITKPTETPNEPAPEAPFYYDYEPRNYKWDGILVPGFGDGETPNTEVPVPGASGEIPVPGASGEVPVPGGSGEIPTPGEIPIPVPGDPVPEPATMAILAAGAMFLRKKRRLNRRK